MTIEVVTTLASVEPAEWNCLAADNPFLRHEFLSALHETGCATPATGWTPQYLLLKDGGRLAGALPLYLKTHSYGEYVFDWAWADAYRRHGRTYYPKLLSAVPFTPVTGSRLLAATTAQRVRLLEAAMELARQLRVSSLHILFPTADEARLCTEGGLMLRNGVQFHWTNPGYRTFDEFLAALNHDKRKKIRQERRKVRDAGISFTWLEGSEITESDWQFFIRCYQRTYAEHRSSPYLNLEFFKRIGQSMPGNLVLIVASREGRSIAASLNVRNRERLFGRYWGALEHHPALHFEACYYQVIEYCIARKLSAFEGGAQGEHKMSRGLMPAETFSAHWLADPAFAAAVEEFLGRETRGVVHYLDELGEHSPFRHDSAADAQQPT